MGTGTVLGVTTLVANGPDEDQWNLVLVGDGYTAGTQQSWFADIAGDFVARLQSVPPFTPGTVQWSRVNVHRVDVASDESGASNPETCDDGTTAFAGSVSSAASFFDAAYCSDGLRRRLVVDEAAVMLEVSALVPEWDVILVVVNHVEPGGSGGGVAVTYAGGIWDDTAIHELGHTAFGLADEYDFRLGCDSGETDRDEYTGGEPVQPNITTVTDRTSIKWAQYVDPATPMPTTVNPDPSRCDTQPSPVGPDEIGAFDGAGQYHHGLYRPAYDCMMRDAGVPFCRVCSDVVIGTIVVQESRCFLVTAVYDDDPWHPDVVTLRSWRDRHLRPGASARPAMVVLDRLYTTLSPTLADRARGRPAVTGPLRRWVFGPLARTLRRRARVVDGV